MWKLLILDTALYSEYALTLDSKMFERSIGYQSFKTGISVFCMIHSIFSSAMFSNSYTSYFTSFDLETEAVYNGELKLSMNEIGIVKQFVSTTPDDIGKYPHLGMISKLRKLVLKKADFKTFEIKLLSPEDLTEPIPELDQSLVRSELKTVEEIQFPNELFKTFVLEYNLDEDFAKQIFAEYAKFLVMMKLSDYNLQGLL